MKKAVLIVVFALVGLGAQAQEGFKAGVNLGLPVGDAGDVSNFSVALDAMYHWEVSETFFAGVATGFSNAFGKTETFSEGGFEIEIEAEDIQFLPIAASGRFNASDSFRIGADLG